MPGGIWTALQRAAVWSALAARRLDRGVGWGLAHAVRLYRALLSPLLGNNCRFEPSCSVYAVESLSRFGFLRGSWRAARRLARCHPWNPGGFDPVTAEVGEDGGG